MIATWMAYSGAVALLLGGSALVLEHTLQHRGWPTRWVWTGAILLSLGAPAMLSVLPRPEPPTISSVPEPQVDSWTVVTMAEHAAAPSIRQPETGSAPSPPPHAPRVDMDRVLWWAWLASSLTLLGAAVFGYSLLALRRRAWRPAFVDASPVLVSRDTGPAVVGFVRGRIVLPEWALAEEPSRQRLIVEHEREHLRARDPLLLLLGVVALVITPWNPVLWWQVGRLRLAVEVDCDARVLARHHDLFAYGSLLLEMGRGRLTGGVPLPAFSESSSLLERRIRAMTRMRSTSTSRLAAGVMLAALLPVGLAAVPLPPSLRVQGQSSPVLAPAAVTDGPGRAVAGVAVPAQLVPAAAGELPRQLSQAQDTVRASYQPEELRSLVERELSALRQASIEGQATLRFVVDAQGRAQHVEVVVADRTELGEAARRVVSQLRFTPARVATRAVPERVSAFPVSFRARRAAPHRPPTETQEILRSVIERFYPQLLQEEPARTPYVFFVVDSLGQMVHRALRWEPPQSSHVHAAIREAVPAVRDDSLGSSQREVVSRGLSDPRPIDVFWAESEPKRDEVDVTRRGPFPLGAASRARSVPRSVMDRVIRARHPGVAERGLGQDSVVWVIGTRLGEVRQSGVGSRNDGAQIARTRLSTEESIGALYASRRADNGSWFTVIWSILAPVEAP